MELNSHYPNRFGDKTAIKMLKDAGFDAFDYSFYCEDDKCAMDLLSDDFEKRADILFPKSNKTVN